MQTYIRVEKILKTYHLFIRKELNGLYCIPFFLQIDTSTFSSNILDRTQQKRFLPLVELYALNSTMLFSSQSGSIKASYKSIRQSLLSSVEVKSIQV